MRRTDGQTRDYRPLEGTLSLYRTLGATEPTQDGILTFVNQYGKLGEGVDVLTVLDDGQLSRVEPLGKWQRTIAWLGEQVRIWEMLQRGNRDGLARVFKWYGEEVVRYRPPDSLRQRLGLHPADEEHMEHMIRILPGSGELESFIAGPGITSELLSRLSPGDVVGPAWYWLLGSVNSMLRSTTQPALLWDEKRAGPVLCYYPRSLLGAAYLQFATAILSGRVSRVCQVCGRSFEVTKIASRNDRLTCSNTCRTRAYRDRQKKAQVMHAAGKTAQEIADILGSELEAVMGWVCEGGDQKPRHR
jgi:hypothetical protein